MRSSEMLEKAEVKGKVLFIGDSSKAVDIAGKLGLLELVVADDDWQRLENTVKSHRSLKVTPVYTRVIERLVELPSQSFDAIISIQGLEKALNKRAFMTETRRLLKEGGKLFINVKIKSLLRKQGLKKEELEKLLNTQGFKTEELIYRGGEADALLIKTKNL